MTVRYRRMAERGSVAGMAPRLVLGVVLSGAILSGGVPVIAPLAQAHADAPETSAAAHAPVTPVPGVSVPVAAPEAVAATAPAAQSAGATAGMSGGVSAGVSTPAVAARPVPVSAPGPAVPTGPLPVGGPAAPELGEEARAVRLQAAQIGLRAFTAPDFHPGKVRHIVLMRFLPTITDAQRAEVVRRFMALGQVSRRDNGQQVIADIETGVQMSGEGVDQGFGQGFVVTFNSEGDRNYYVGKPVVSDPAYFDPAHEAFKKFAAPYIIGVLVFDYALPAHQAQRTRRAAVMRPGMTQQQG